jgi:hypothetical protein
MVAIGAALCDRLLFGERRGAAAVLLQCDERGRTAAAGAEQQQRHDGAAAAAAAASTAAAAATDNSGNDDDTLLRVRLPSLSMLESARAAARQQLPWPVLISSPRPLRRGGGWLEMRSTLVLSVGFLFNFTAWHSAQNLQSSLHMPVHVSGNTALAIVYLLLGPGFFTAPAVVQRVGEVKCIWGAFLMYSTFMVANMMPRTYTLYPAAVMVGLACPPLFVAEQTILTRLAVSYAQARGYTDPTAKVGLFQGIFNSIFMTTQVIGNTFYALVFRAAREHDTDDGSTASAQSEVGDGQGLSAGSTSAMSHDLWNPSRQTVVTLFEMYFCVMMGGVAVVYCGLQLPETARASTMLPSRRGCSTFHGTLRLLRTEEILALVPLFISSSMFGAFVISDFTKSFVKPALGEENLGFIMAISGVGSAVGSFVFGWVSDKAGAYTRVASVCFGGLTNATIGCILYAWTPRHSDSMTAWCRTGLMALAIGLGSSASDTALRAHLSANFQRNTESAFAISGMFSGLMSGATFLAVGHLPMRSMLLVAIPAQVIGVAGFVASAVLCLRAHHIIGEAAKIHAGEKTALVRTPIPRAVSFESSSSLRFPINPAESPLRPPGSGQDLHHTAL